MKIELGITEKMPASPCEVGASPKGAKCKDHTSYPTMYIRAKAPINLPDGKFSFTCEGKVVSRTERTESRGDDDPTERCDYDIEVYSIEPKGSAEKADDVGGSLRKGAMKLMKDKTDEGYKE